MAHTIDTYAAWLEHALAPTPLTWAFEGFRARFDLPYESE